MKRFLLFIAVLFAWSAALCYTSQVIEVPAKAIKGPMKVTVITPDSAAMPGARFPVVYLLNGHGGDYTSWTTNTDPGLGRYADQYGMVLVMPDGRDSWYWDSPKHPEMAMETFITTELVPYIDASFPTLPSPGKRAITGFSMGGHGALWLAMRHPDIFGSAGSMSGGVDIRPFPEKWHMSPWLGPIGENRASWDSHTVINLVPTLEDGTLNIIFDCGSGDFFAEVNENLHKALLKKGIKHTYQSRPGVHSHKYWRRSAEDHIRFFDDNFRSK